MTSSQINKDVYNFSEKFGRMTANRRVEKSLGAYFLDVNVTQFSNKPEKIKYLLSQNLSNVSELQIIVKTILETHPKEYWESDINSLNKWLTSLNLRINDNHNVEILKDPSGEAMINNRQMDATNASTSKNIIQKDIVEKEKHVYKFDVALSFAGEDREVAEEIAIKLKSNGIRVFYDDFQKVDLWGEKLSQHFKETYGTNTRFVIIFVSEHYALKDWTDFEFSIALNEAKTRKREFILPIRIDNTNIVGLHNDVGYLDLNKESVESIVEIIRKKLKT